MKTVLTIGVVSEALLVAGIFLVALGVDIAVANQMPIPHCGEIGCYSYSALFETPIFYLGLVLLIASACGFLFTLKAALTTKGGTPN